MKTIFKKIITTNKYEKLYFSSWTYSSNMREILWSFFSVTNHLHFYLISHKLFHTNSSHQLSEILELPLLFRGNLSIYHRLFIYTFASSNLLLFWGNLCFTLCIFLSFSCTSLAFIFLLPYRYLHISIISIKCWNKI